MMTTAAALGQTDLGSVKVGSSATTLVPLTIVANGTLANISVVTQGASGLDYTNAGNGTCKVGTAYIAGQTCTVGVKYKPIYSGSISGAIVIHSATEILASEALLGKGIGPQIALSPSKVKTFDPPVKGPDGLVGLVFPSGVAVDGAGTQYIVNGTVGGIVEIPGNGGSAFYFDPVVEGVLVGDVLDVAVDGAGDLFMLDATNARVVESRPDGSFVQFFDPFSSSPILNAMALGPTGDLFIYDGQNGIVFEYPGGNYQETPIEIVATYYGEALTRIAPFAEDGEGNLFIVDASLIQLDELSAAQVRAGGGEVTVVVNDFQDLIPSEIAFGGNGDLYIVDGRTNEIVVLPPGTTLPPATQPAITITPSIALGDQGTLGGISIDRAGNLFFADLYNNRIIEILRSQSAGANFLIAPTGDASPDSPQITQVQNIGTAPLNFTELSFPTDFPQDAEAASPCTVSAPLAASQACNLAIDFLPKTAATFSEEVTLVDNNLNVSTSKQTVPVSGLGYEGLLSTYSLDFGQHLVGTSSQSQQVTLTNTTSAPLRITGIQLTGADFYTFVIGYNCPASLPVGASCTIHGHFIATSPGLLTAAIIITDSGPGSPRTVALSGLGLTAPAVSFSATQLSFGLQEVGTQSPSQQITLTNTGGSPLSFTSITATGPDASSFVIGNDCPSHLAAGASCIIHGHFAPKVADQIIATITVKDDAAGPPQVISLSGIGTNQPTTVSLSSASLAFGTVKVGASSASQSVTFKNTGASVLNIRGIVVGGADASSFVFANSCGSTLAAGASCTIHGHFSPATKGALSAAVTITDSANTATQSITLTGTGQ